MESASPTKHQSFSLFVKALMLGTTSENALYAVIYSCKWRATKNRYYS